MEKGSPHGELLPRGRMEKGSPHGGAFYFFAF